MLNHLNQQFAIAQIGPKTLIITTADDFCQEHNDDDSVINKVNPLRLINKIQNNNNESNNNMNYVKINKFHLSDAIIKRNNIESNKLVNQFYVDEYIKFIEQKDFKLNGRYKKITTTSLGFMEDEKMNLELKPCIKFKNGSFIGWYRYQYNKNNETSFSQPRPILHFSHHDDYAEIVNTLEQLHKFNKEEKKNMVFDLVYSVQHGEDNTTLDTQNNLIVNRLATIDLLIKHCHNAEYDYQKNKFSDSISHNVRGIGHFIDRNSIDESKLNNDNKLIEKMTMNESNEALSLILTTSGQNYYSELLRSARSNKSNVNRLFNIAKKFRNQEYYQNAGNGVAPVTLTSILTSVLPTTLANNRSDKKGNNSRKELIKQYNSFLDQSKGLVINTKLSLEDNNTLQSENTPSLIVHLSVPNIEVEESEISNNYALKQNNEIYKVNSEFNKENEHIKENEDMDTILSF